MRREIIISGLVILALLLGGLFYFYSDEIIKYFSQRSFTVEPEEDKGEENVEEKWPESTISGISCENYNRRPFAVMIAEDYAARPLSGIAMADLIMEMPVVTGSITRMMAIFQCEIPNEIGSIRSARHDFISLAAGLDAIFAHWGGSHYALSKLKEGTLDNIDALPNPYNVFYRKSGVPAPHNGFTSMDRLLNAAEKLGYRLESGFEGYQHENPNDIRLSPKAKGMVWPIQNPKEDGILKIDYSYPYNVRYEYNSDTNSYLRWRGGLKEIDKLTGGQVEVKNVVVVRAESRQIGGQYNDVDIEGEGEAIYYIFGDEYKGYWQKDKSSLASKLYFYDENDEEVKFAPGKIWIHIVEPYQEVKWETIE